MARLARVRAVYRVDVRRYPILQAAAQRRRTAGLCRNRDGGTDCGRSGQRRTTGLALGQAIKTARAYLEPASEVSRRAGPGRVVARSASRASRAARQDEGL